MFLPHIDVDLFLSFPSSLSKINTHIKFEKKNYSLSSSLLVVFNTELGLLNILPLLCKLYFD